MKLNLPIQFPSSSTGLGTDVLGEEISVDIVDGRNGTATSGVDYLEFLPQTITFPAGSVEGDSQTVEFGILQDSILEGDGNGESKYCQG